MSGRRPIAGLSFMGTRILSCSLISAATTPFMFIPCEQPDLRIARLGRRLASCTAAETQSRYDATHFLQAVSDRAPRLSFPWFF